MATFEASQLYAHTKSLSGSTLKGRQQAIAERNLIGTVDEITERIAAYRDVGVTTISALIFAYDTVEQTLDAMQEFGRSSCGPLPGRRPVLFGPGQGTGVSRPTVHPLPGGCLRTSSG